MNRGRRQREERTFESIQRVPLSTLADVSMEYYEEKLKRLFVDENRLENLIVYSGNNDVDTSRIRRRLLDVTAKIRELSGFVGIEKAAVLQEQAKRVTD